MKQINIAFSISLPDTHIRIQTSHWLKKHGVNGTVARRTDAEMFKIFTISIEDSGYTYLSLKCGDFHDEFVEIFGSDNVFRLTRNPYDEHQITIEVTS